MTIGHLPRSISLVGRQFGMLASMYLIAAQALGAVEPGPAQIVVSGMGEVTVMPDHATLLVAVETSASTAAAAGADNAKLHKQVMAALAAAGVPADELSSTGYSLQPVWRYADGTQTRTGYRASNNIRVSIRQLDRVGALIDSVLTAGATGVADLIYDSTATDQSRLQALAKAEAQAHVDAETLARAAGGKLGALLELSTRSDAHIPGIRLESVAVSAARARASEPTTLEPQAQHIEATVDARWQFIPGAP